MKTRTHHEGVVGKMHVTLDLGLVAKSSSVSSRRVGLICKQFADSYNVFFLSHRRHRVASFHLGSSLRVRFSA